MRVEGSHSGKKPVKLRETGFKLLYFIFFALFGDD